MTGGMLRLKLRVIDALRHSLVVREAAGWMHFARGRMSGDATTRAARLSRAIGFATSTALISRCIRALQTRPGIDHEAETWRRVVSALPRYSDLRRDEPLLDRSIVLKAPRANGEKGVLLMTFEYNWARVLLGLNDEDFKWLDERFDLVLSTSWSPTDYAALALAVSRVKGTVFVQSCNHLEIDTIERFHPRLKCLPTLPCDWINPALYSPKPASERSTDFLMVANWGEFKRHWELFEALARMPADLRVVLIGQPDSGRTLAMLRALAKDLGVPQELHMVERIPIAEVTRHQCDAKVSIIMTRREGCCVAAVESLFAGCALAMRADAHVGPLAYIQDETGARLLPGRVAEGLMALLKRSRDLDPRSWAAAHVSGEVSLKKVNALLAATAAAQGRPWTADLVLPQWRPHPTFARSEDMEAMRAVYEELHRRFPHVFSDTLISESWR